MYDQHDGSTPVKRTKTPSPLWNLDIGQFQQAIDWLKTEAQASGYDVAEARFVPDLATWMFYDGEGELTVRISHGIVERVKVALEEIYQHRLDAQIDELMKQPRREW